MVQVQTHRQAGFTLIELVMVIVILGILSAFALPRFADLSGDARAASIEGLAGSLKSAAAIAHAQALVDNVTTGNISLEGSNNVAVINGYPSVAGIVVAANVSAGAAGSNNDYQSAATATTIRFGIMQTTGAINNNCSVLYTQATATVAATVASVTTGC